MSMVWPAIPNRTYECSTLNYGHKYSWERPLYATIAAPNVQTTREYWKLRRVNQRLTIVLSGATQDEQPMVGVAGLEPARYLYQWILSPSRLPIPPHPHLLTLVS